MIYSSHWHHLSSATSRIPAYIHIRVGRPCNYQNRFVSLYVPVCLRLYIRPFEATNRIFSETIGRWPDFNIYPHIYVLHLTLTVVTAFVRSDAILIERLSGYSLGCCCVAISSSDRAFQLFIASHSIDKTFLL